MIMKFKHSLTLSQANSPSDREQVLENYKEIKDINRKLASLIKS